MKILNFIDGPTLRAILLATALAGITLCSDALMSRGRSVESLGPNGFRVPKSLLSLPLGTQLEGFVTYGQDPSRPALTFVSGQGARFEKSCDKERSSACYAIAFQSAFAQALKVERVSNVVLTVSRSATGKPLCLLWRTHQVAQKTELEDAPFLVIEA